MSNIEKLKGEEGRAPSVLMGHTGVALRCLALVLVNAGQPLLVDFLRYHGAAEVNICSDLSLHPPFSRYFVTDVTYATATRNVKRPSSFVLSYLEACSRVPMGANLNKE